MNQSRDPRFSGKAHGDLLSEAVSDCRQLQAYAAQSNFALEETLTLKLTEAMLTIEQYLSVDSAVKKYLDAKAEVSFWTAYDQLAAAMHPVSAASIRFSEEVTQRSAAFSLMHPNTWSLRSPTFWTLSFLLTFIVLQSWNMVAADLYGKVREFEKQQDSLQAQIAKSVLAQSNKLPSKDKNDSGFPPKELEALQQVVSSNQLMHRSLCNYFLFNEQITGCINSTSPIALKEKSTEHTLQDHFEALKLKIVLQRNFSAQIAGWLNVLMQALLPALLGLLGALTFELRRVHDQIKNYQHLPITGRGLFTRVTLGMTGGIFGVLLLPTGEWLSSGTIKLPSILVPFLLGYGAEIFYRFLDHMMANLVPKKIEMQPNAAQLSNLDVKRLKDISKS